MKKIAFILAFTLVLSCGCTAAPAAVTPTPDAEVSAPASYASAAPEATAAHAAEASVSVDGVSVNERTVYYPDGADEANAQFRLVYALPVFDDTLALHAAFNAEVSLYEEELLERISSERLPYADAADGFVPYTRVTCSVEECRGFINVYLYEYTSFDAAEGEELLPRILVLSPDGERASLYSASGCYDAEAVAAQQVFNLIDANRAAYYGDITLDDITSAIDLYSGFFMTEDGYALVAAPGTLAPEDEAESTFFIDRSAFYPATVGDVISSAEYEALSAPLGLLAAACGLDYSGFSNGAPNAFTATTFMTLLLTTGHEDGLYSPVDTAEYEAAYLSYFSVLPSDLTASDLNDGTFEDNGCYMLPVYPHSYWSLRVDDAVRTQTGLVLYGMILYGIPGTSDAGELCAVTVTVESFASSPMGYRFTDVEIR